jgi:uncharacterized protein YbbC (DUF1343 family)
MLLKGLAKVGILLLAGLLPARAQEPVPGDARLSRYLPQLTDQAVGVVANHTARIGNTHLVDTLLSHGIRIRQIFAPEHGFRGDRSAGATIRHGKDQETGIPVFSLYGSTKKPTPESLEGIDRMVFDIQDVGCRFYTYISTLHYVMEACAEAGIPLIVLDRPNPNGDYLAGPVLDTAYRSFVGMHPVPVVHGMTIGEYAQMINGEGWLPQSETCELTVVRVAHYDHNTDYKLPIAPSPNLPNQDAIRLYPSLCFFEGTPVSVGRGTAHPFQVLGLPDYKAGGFTFTPRSIPGKAANPAYEGEQCRGYDLRAYLEGRRSNSKNQQTDHLQYKWLVRFYQNMGEPDSFFEPYFTKLAGTPELQKLIERGATPKAIRNAWKADLQAFQDIRKQYLLYPDFR